MTHQLAYADYLDRVTAGWIGKSIGGAIGAPLENMKTYHALATEQLWPKVVAPNDDLDIQVVWLEALQERGLYLTAHDLADFWVDRCWYNFCEYGVFLHNLQRGIHPPLSGTFDNEFYVESEGCPIRSEIWGFVCPGNPELAASYAKLDAQLDHGGASIDIECFNAACAAQAVLGSDLETVLRAGLSVIPADCAAARAVPAVRAICAACPDPAKAWRRVLRSYGDRDASKAMTNHALVLMSLFLGQLDFTKTMCITACSGWDTDCTAATAGALVAAMQGTRCLPADWVSRLGPNLVCGITVPHSGQPLSDFARETALIGVEMALARNPLITLTGAPAVTVRPAPVAAPEIAATYAGAPELRADRPSAVTLTVERSGPGRLELIAPPHLRATITAPPVVAGNRATAQVRVELAPGVTAMPNRNLIDAVWRPQVGPAVHHTFGLAGARQWQVYGPYWDMWDVDRSRECPYDNPNRRCPPHEAGMIGDAYNHYVRRDHPYLDEARLLVEDLPDEDPLRLQLGRELITESDLGGFKGQGVYYFVRTFQWGGDPRDCSLGLGRMGPYRIWLDGQATGEAADLTCWAPFGSDAQTIKLTGKPQRLVIKAVRLTEQFALSATFFGGGDWTRKRGISLILDDLADAVG